MKERGAFQVYGDTYVTEESGTGIVHHAPYFGEDDYRVNPKYGVITKDMEPICPVDMSGKFDERVTVFQDQYGKADESVGEGTLSESLESVSSREWRRQHSVSVPDYPCCLRLIRGELWQCHGGGITVYDTALRWLRNVERGDMGYVNDVAPLPGGDIVVAANNGLYTMTDRGKRRDRIAEGWFAGVVHHADRLYAANCGTATVHVFTHSGRWTQCHSFSLNATAEYIITVSVSRNLLHVCLLGDDRLDVLSLDGELQYSAGSPGSGAAGQLNCPVIGATDAEGTTLIADNSNHRVQTLSPSRQWGIVSLHPRVDNPRGALLRGGKLYISSSKDNKLHVYE